MTEHRANSFWILEVEMVSKLKQNDITNLAWLISYHPKYHNSRLFGLSLLWKIGKSEM
jgi:hypothetical protein